MHVSLDDLLLSVRFTDDGVTNQRLADLLRTANRIFNRCDDKGEDLDEIENQ